MPTRDRPEGGSEAIEGRAAKNVLNEIPGEVDEGTVNIERSRP